MLYIRSSLFLICFYLLTSMLSILYLPLLLLPRRQFAPLARIWVRIVVTVSSLLAGIRYEVRGQERRPKGPVIYACKHQSAWETLAFNLIFHDCAFVMKKELLRLPFFGWYLTRMGNISVDRKAGSKALRLMVNQALATLADKRDIVIFPQGTRTSTGDSDSPYLSGVAGLYSRTSVPVVPVALNSGMFWPRNKFLKYPGKIIVELLDPIPPNLGRQEFINRLRAEIEPATRRLEEETRSLSKG